VIKYTRRAMERRLGVHTSIAGGLAKALRRARDLGCTAVQIFSHNPRGWRTGELPEEEAALFRRERERLDISPVAVHASYLINLASPRKDLRRASIALLAEEMRRADLLGADYVVLHPGRSREGNAARLSVQGMAEALELSSPSRTGLLIENTSGKRGDVASSMEQVARILQAAGGAVRGICLDTCHAYAAGYDLGTEEGLRTLSEKMEAFFGLSRVLLVHLNDSRGGLGSGLDRHEHIGKGKIGSRGMKRFLHHESFGSVPLILETPKTSPADDPENLRRVRALLR
jgi:deoxyribonuclease-4